MDHRTAPLSTGVPGLDLILGGGLPRGGMFFVVGAPGAGKTVLTFQIAFHAVQTEGPVLFLTTLSEPHNKLLSHTRSLAFFDADRIGNGLELVNLQSLMQASAEGTVESIVSMARNGRMSLVIIDGFNSLRGFLKSDHAAREFLYDVGAKLALLNIALVINIQADPQDTASRLEFTVADGLLGVFYERQGAGHRRYLEVLKRRGSSYLDGLHSFTITQVGITCYPQLESLPIEARPPFGSGRAAFGLPELDAMLDGGVGDGTMTMLLGGPGAGKSLTGLHFLMAGAARGERGLLFSFQETEAQLLASGTGFGLDLAGQVAAGRIEIVTWPPVRLVPDILIQDLLTRLDRSGARRLLIDSARELERSLDAQREPDFLSALVAHLRARGVTTVLTREIPKIVSPELDFSDTSASILAENVILFRYVEYRGQLRRLVSVIKMRFSRHDLSLREFRITERGISVLGGVAEGEGLLTGIARGIGHGAQ